MFKIDDDDCDQYSHEDDDEFDDMIMIKHISWFYYVVLS